MARRTQAEAAELGRRAAAEHGLGEVVEELAPDVDGQASAGRRVLLRMAPALVGGLVIGMGGALVAVWREGDGGARAFVTGAVALALLVLGPLVYALFRPPAYWLGRCAEGVVHVRTSRPPVVLPYRDLAAVGVTEANTMGNPNPAGLVRVTFRRVTGRPYVVDRVTGGWHDLAAGVVAAHADVLTTGALARVRAGQEVTLHGIVLAPDGVRWRKDTHPWADIARPGWVRRLGKESLELRLSGRERPWGRLPGSADQGPSTLVALSQVLATVATRGPGLVAPDVAPAPDPAPDPVDDPVDAPAPTTDVAPG